RHSRCATQISCSPTSAWFAPSLTLLPSIIRGPAQRSTLFPYTTLFRSGGRAGRASRRRHPGREAPPVQRRVHGLRGVRGPGVDRSEEHTSELQSRENLVCRLPLEKKKKKNN